MRIAVFGVGASAFGYDLPDFDLAFFDGAVVGFCYGPAGHDALWHVVSYHLSEDVLGEHGGCCDLICQRGFLLCGGGGWEFTLNDLGGILPNVRLPEFIDDFLGRQLWW